MWCDISSKASILMQICSLCASEGPHLFDALRLIWWLHPLSFLHLLL